MKTPLTTLPLFALLGLSTPVLAEEAATAPPWAATVRAGGVAVGLRHVVRHSAGPDVELSLGRTIFEMVSVEVNAGVSSATLTPTGTRLTIIPLTVSLKLTAPPDRGFEPYAVVGLGASLTRLRGGSLAAAASTQVAYHAGLGIRRRFGASLFAGLDGRVFFQGAAGPVGALDGLRLSALAGVLF